MVLRVDGFMLGVSGFVLVGVAGYLLVVVCVCVIIGRGHVTHGPTHTTWNHLEALKWAQMVPNTRYIAIIGNLRRIPGRPPKYGT